MAYLRETDIRELSRMVGHTWVMDLEEEPVDPGIFRGQGGLRIEGERLFVWKAWVRCKRYDEDRNVLVMDFSLVVIAQEYGGAPEAVEGIAYCDIESEREAD
jgi:hypothetical protein